MLSAEDHPGVFYFLVGIIVLVMTGVGLSLLVDKRLKFSSGNSAIQKEIALYEEELASLRSTHEQVLLRLNGSGDTVKNDSAALASHRRKSDGLVQRRAELERTRADLAVAIPSLENQFSSYRAEYRQQTWNGAIGRKIGTLAIRGGRIYQDAEITRVTDVGLEIRHRDGIARIQGPDLDAEWQDRFQWSDEERRNRLKEELANHESIAPPSPPTEMAELPGNPDRPRRPGEAADPGELASLRLKVSAWNNKVSRLKSERSEANSQSSYGAQTSVTGSLETWKAKVTRINAELIKAQAELAVAKSRLAAVAPNDVMLRPPVRESGFDD